MAEGTLSCAMMPKWIASGAYHTRISVCSSAGRPSTGWYCQNPVSRAACAHAGSSSTPSMRIDASTRGMSAVGEPFPSTTAPVAADWSSSRVASTGRFV